MAIEPIHICMTHYGPVRVSHAFYKKHALTFGHSWGVTKPVSDIVANWAERAWFAGMRLKSVK